MSKERVNDLPAISKVDKDKLHKITIEILKKFNFDNDCDIIELADKYSDAYIKVYNFLVNKYYEERSEKEKTSQTQVANLISKAKLYPD